MPAFLGEGGGEQEGMCDWHVCVHRLPRACVIGAQRSAILQVMLEVITCSYNLTLSKEGLGKHLEQSCILPRVEMERAKLNVFVTLWSICF